VHGMIRAVLSFRGEIIITAAGSRSER
jgi:hypothetical protein